MMWPFERCNYCRNYIWYWQKYQYMSCFDKYDYSITAPVREQEGLLKTKSYYHIKCRLDYIQKDVVIIRNIPKEQAKKEITEYVKANPGTLNTQLVEVLGIDPEIVIEVLEELKVEGTLTNDKIQRSN